MEKFNLSAKLIEKGYSEEIVEKSPGEFFCKLYQKEIIENNWNAVSIFKNGEIFGCDISGNLFKNMVEPTNIFEFEDLILKIECHESSK